MDIKAPVPCSRAEPLGSPPSPRYLPPPPTTSHQLTPRCWRSRQASPEALVARTAVAANANNPTCMWGMVGQATFSRHSLVFSNVPGIFTAPLKSTGCPGAGRPLLDATVVCSSRQYDRARLGVLATLSMHHVPREASPVATHTDARAPPSRFQVRRARSKWRESQSPPCGPSSQISFRSSSASRTTASST